MKKLLLLLLAVPVVLSAQVSKGEFVKDTLYTSTGFKIYKGQTLHFGVGKREDGKFRYINIKNDVSYKSLTNNSIVVKKLKNFGISMLGNGYIEIIGKITFKDGSKGLIDIHMAFDHVLEETTRSPAELIVPEEFRIKQIENTTAELERLYKLYQDGAITKEEYEIQKKKLTKE